MKKLLIASAIVLAVASSQGAVVRWGGSTVGSGTGTTDWSDGNSWYDTSVGTGTAYGVPTHPTDTHALIGSEDGGVVVTSALGTTVPATIGVGWDTPTGSMTVANGGSLNAGNVYIGWGSTPSTGVLTIESGAIMTAGSINMGGGTNVNSGVVNMTGGLLHMGNVSIVAGRFDMRNDAYLLLNGNWLGAGFVGAYIFAPDAGTSIHENYDGLNGRTEWTVIPEPATFGLVAAFGGAMLFLRKKIMI